MPEQISDQVKRVMLILRWLSAGERMTTREILDRMRAEDDAFKEVSERTIQRDLQQMSEAGSPIERFNDGLQRRWRILRGAGISLQHSQDPRLSLYMLKAALPQFAGLEVGDELHALMAKINELTDGDVVDTELIQNITLGEFTGFIDPDILRQVIDAIIDRTWVTITYGLSKDQRTYFPARIIPYAGRLYLAAWSPDSKTWFSLGIDRILSVTAPATETASPKPPTFSVDTFMANRFGIWTGKGAPQKIVVQVDAELARTFKDRRWHPTQEVTVIDDGHLEITFTASITPELVSWVLHWTPHLKVLKPKKLRDEVIAKLQEGITLQQNA